MNGDRSRQDSQNGKRSPLLVICSVLSPLTWTTGDLWRWLMLLFGVLFIGKGLFSRNVRIRDSSTVAGWWRGKIATKPWQVLYMRSLLVGIGIAFIVFAFTFHSSQ